MDVSTIWDFCGEVVGTIRPHKGYVPATVTRIDADGTVWVTTGDGTEAPASTCAAGVAVGDVVSVSWSGAQMGVVGNASDPAAGTSAVDTVRKAAAAAGRLAEDAKSIAEATGQFFWHDDSGVHVSTEKGNPTGAQNTLWNSLGMLFRAGTTNLLAIVAGTDSGMDVYDGQGNEDENVIASHRGSGTRIGYLSGFNSVIQAGLFSIRYATDRLFSVTSDGWQTNIYMGGSTKPSGVSYTDSQLLTITDYLRAGCTVSGTNVLDPQGEETGYQVEQVTQRLDIVVDSGGTAIDSAAYEGIYHYVDGTRHVFTAEPRLYPQSEIPATPANIDMGGVGIGASDGVLTIHGETTHDGDVAWTALTLDSAAAAYNSDSTPRYRRWGQAVEVEGAVKPTAEVTAGGTLTIGTLPTGCRPPRELDTLCQGSGGNVWMLRITTAGVVTAERYRSGATNVAMPTTAWLTFNATFMV